MNSKYGSYPDSQIHQHKDTLHSDIFKLLWMKEENYEQLDEYFSTVLWKLNGYNEVFNCQPVMIDILSILEEARIEALKEDYSHKKYRKAILDCMSLVNKLQESEGDTDAGDV